VQWVFDPSLNDSGWEGWCREVEDFRFEIRVATNMTPAHTWSLCLHEAAHCRQFLFHPDEEIDHGPGWAQEFGRIYRQFVGERLPGETE
jgi:hypothetical protein